MILQVKIMRQLHMMTNPENTRNRETMKDNYGIQLPIINKKDPEQVCYLCHRIFLQKILA